MARAILHRKHIGPGYRSSGFSRDLVDKGADTWCSGTTQLAIFVNGFAQTGHLFPVDR
jgi:hypothetical protein